MRINIDQNWPRDGVDVYIVQDGVDYSIPYTIEDGHFKLDPNNTVQSGETFAPTLFIPNPIYSQLRKAMIGEAIDSDDALQDTRRVRDRLLTMIEAEWQSKQLEKA